MQAFLLGYTIEKSNCPSITSRILDRILTCHCERNMPATFFILGKSAETNHGDLDKFNSNNLFDFAQHTYSHIGFKTIIENRSDGTEYHLPGVSLKDIEVDVQRAENLIELHFNRRCFGVEGARGYYSGLTDRPDVVELLVKLGFRYCVTYCRNKNGWNPVDLSVQPFWYLTDQGLRLLEIPNQGWQDAAYIKQYGENSAEDYYSCCRDAVRQAIEENLVLSLIMHDWTLFQWDKDLNRLCRLYDAILESGASILNFKQFYEIQADEHHDRT